MTVYKAGIPVLAPPDTTPTPEPHDASLDGSSSQKIDDALPEWDIGNSRLRTDEPIKGLSRFDQPLRVDSHEPLEVDHVDLNAFEGECDHPFSFFYLIAVKRARLMIKMLNCNWIRPRLENKPLLSIPVNGRTKRKVARDWQEGNQQLDHKEIRRSQSWGIGAHRSFGKRQTKKKGHNRRLPIHRASRWCGQSSLTNSNAD